MIESQEPRPAPQPEPTGEEPIRAEVEVTPVEPSVPVETPGPMTPEQRTAALSEAVSRETRQGYKVESQQPNQVVLVGQGFRVHHGTHAVITVLTAGLWGIVWIIQWLRGRQPQIILTVDDQGRVDRESSHRAFKG